MSVYRRREPDNSSKIARRYNYKQVGRDLFFYAGTSTFSFLSLSSWAAWKTIFCALAFVEVPPQPLVPHLSHRFSLWQGRLSTQQPLSISCWPMNTRSKTDEKERRSNAVGEDRSLSRKSPVFFFRISFSYASMFSYFLPFQFEIKHCAILLPWKLFLSMKVVPFVRAYSYSGL